MLCAGEALEGGEDESEDQNTQVPRPECDKYTKAASSLHTTFGGQFDMDSILAILKTNGGDCDTVHV